MSFTLWIKIEDDEDTGDEAWWSVNHFATAEQAIAEAEDICAQYYARTGIEPERLDGDLPKEYDEPDCPACHDPFNTPECDGVV